MLSGHDDIREHIQRLSVEPDQFSEALSHHAYIAQTLALSFIESAQFHPNSSRRSRTKIMATTATTGSARDARAMPGFRRLFAACFHKRTERPSSKLPQSEGATETDGSESTLLTLSLRSQTPQSKSHPSSQIPNYPTPPQSTKDPDSTMPKARKTTTKKGPAKAATLSSQPYQVQPPPSSESGSSKAKSKAFKKYFSSGGSAVDMGAGESQQKKQLKEKLNQMFDELLNEEDTEGATAGEPPNALGASATMAYIELLGANPENYGMFVVLDIVKAETMGEITRTGFVEGWTQVFDEEKVPADLSAHKRLVKARLNEVQVDDAYYKRLYQLAFRIGKDGKAMPMSMALVMWSVLFDPKPHRAWQSANINWLKHWQTYLREKYWVPAPGADANDEEAGKWARSVSKDLWNQTLVFAQKAIQDESLGFWSEEQAWPGMIDEFVVWAKDKGFVPAAAKPAAELDMDVDE